MTEKQYADYVYNLLAIDSEGLDSIYEDYITHLVGLRGLNALLSNKLLESCGVINGRQLYVLIDKN